MTESYERPEFQNAVEYTVSITYCVAGGARHGTADRRASRVAERLANAAARAKDVVEVAATEGRSSQGEIVWAEPVAFGAANSGRATRSAPGKLTRYVDPEHERARLQLQEHNRVTRERREYDRARRQAVGCRARHHSVFQPRPQWCACVYCAPAEHLDAVRDDLRDGTGSGGRLCLCGAFLNSARRCLAHCDVVLVVLDGDEPALVLLADEEEAST